MPDQINPCPFCNRDSNPAVKSPGERVFYVECYRCGARGPQTTRSKAHALKLWNNRMQGDSRYCHPCQLVRGGKVPKHGHMGITVTMGQCGGCGKKATLVPNRDYDWPDSAAWFD